MRYFVFLKGRETSRLQLAIMDAEAVKAQMLEEGVEAEIIEKAIALFTELVTPCAVRWRQSLTITLLMHRMRTRQEHCPIWSCTAALTTMGSRRRRSTSG